MPNIRVHVIIRLSHHCLFKCLVYVLRQNIIAQLEFTIIGFMRLSWPIPAQICISQGLFKGCLSFLAWSYLLNMDNLSRTLKQKQKNNRKPALLKRLGKSALITAECSPQQKRIVFAFALKSFCFRQTCYIDCARNCFIVISKAENKLSEPLEKQLFASLNYDFQLTCLG